MDSAAITHNGQPRFAVADRSNRREHECIHPERRSIPPNIASQCVAMVEIALRHGNHEEAIAAINRTWRAASQAEKDAVVTDETLLACTTLDLRIVNLLELRGLRTVGDVRKLRPNQLGIRGSQIGNKSVAEIIAVCGMTAMVGGKEQP
jgi:hypothetical protein